MKFTKKAKRGAFIAAVALTAGVSSFLFFQEIVEDIGQIKLEDVTPPALKSVGEIAETANKGIKPVKTKNEGYGKAEDNGAVVFTEYGYIMECESPTSFRLDVASDKSNDEKGTLVKADVTFTGTIDDKYKSKLKEGTMVYLKDDSEGNTHIYFSDGTMLEDWLVDNGYAQKQS